MGEYTSVEAEDAMADIKKIFLTYFYFIWFLVLAFDLWAVSAKAISSRTFIIIFVIFIAGYVIYGFWLKKKMYG